jgi:hypothetical protein
MAETMTVNEKVLRALRTAANYLEKSMLTFNQKNETSFADNLWHVAAELEYALFMFSITFQNEHSPSWKPNPEKADAKSVLEEVQSLLGEAEKFVAEEKLLESYKNTYIARHYIRKVQEDLTKKKRERLKKEK